MSAEGSPCSRICRREDDLGWTPSRYPAPPWRHATDPGPSRPSSSRSAASPPPKAFAKAAHVWSASVYRKADRNFEKFWAGFAKELDWFRPWKQVLDWKPPQAKWFVGGKLNVSVNCLDRHLDEPRRNKAALIWEGEPGDQRTLTYRELHREVCKFANVLKSLGVRQGRPRHALPADDPGAADRDARLRADRRDPLGRLRRLLGRVAARPDQRPGREAPRHGRRRLAARQRRAAEADRRRGARADARRSRTSSSCGARAPTVALQRRPRPLVARADGSGADCPASPSRWTPKTRSSSSTPPARPASRRASCTRPPATSSGPMRPSKWVFDLKDDDVYWCTADIGWVTGHSYVVYGPLANGATCLMYEGAPDSPARDRFWDLIERHGVTILYTAPTAIRAFMKWGDRVAGEARPLVAAPARLGRGADQSRGVDLVPRSTSAAGSARSSTRGGRRRRG